MPESEKTVRGRGLGYAYACPIHRNPTKIPCSHLICHLYTLKITFTHLHTCTSPTHHTITHAKTYSHTHTTSVSRGGDGGGLCAFCDHMVRVKVLWECVVSIWVLCIYLCMCMCMNKLCVGGVCVRVESNRNECARVCKVTVVECVCGTLRIFHFDTHTHTSSHLQSHTHSTSQIYTLFTMIVHKYIVSTPHVNTYILVTPRVNVISLTSRISVHRPHHTTIHPVTSKSHHKHIQT